MFSVACGGYSFLGFRLMEVVRILIRGFGVEEESRRRLLVLCFGLFVLCYLLK